MKFRYKSKKSHYYADIHYCLILSSTKSLHNWSIPNNKNDSSSIFISLFSLIGKAQGIYTLAFSSI